jgi:hypothetical protein
MASFFFDQYAEQQAGEGTFADFKDDTIRVRVVSDTDIVPARTLTNMSTISAYTGSTDATLSSKTVGTLAARVMDAADSAMGSFAQDGGKTIDGIVIYKFVTNDADSEPMMYIDLSSPGTPNGSAVTIQWNVLGIAKIDA